MEGKEPTLYACNQCGSTEIVQQDYIPATVRIRGFIQREDGALEPEYADGGSDVHWDGQRPADEDEPYTCDECDAALNDKSLIRVVSWQPDVQADSTGTWATNALRFATKEEAEASANELMGRWMLVTDTRAFPSPDPVNYRWDFDTHTNERI